ncbi:hypothetical protein LOTGIDRAFT_234627 [Lottia gigantea]|uniref:Ribosomal protein eL8/eL30/eS12/Gadd45 domain-containing protein n=1 Tax=Lottia gigantea TaxID=225164 RepID=V3ZV96_LOTGI|nr:hypothetical protein LOTGIDRAFT_234627 [Lottia gigantea]ESO88302.1 hypothetical protein LOTGIDRAFT_234627 [Lottia gigantea]
MTFTESGEVVGMEKIQKSKKPIGEVLQECLWQAIDHQRITSGVFECAKLLHCNPENVMICVLPEAESENISIHIQHTLIEAFCWENDIRILKVKNASSLSKCLYTFQDGDEKRIIPDDLSCMLVEYPKGRLSVEDETISDFYEEMIASDIFPKPVIELPV